MRINTLVALSVLAAAAAGSPVAQAAGTVETTAGFVDHSCTRNATALWFVFGENVQEACGQIYGRPGYQGVKPCQPPPAQVVGYPRVIMTAVHEAVKDDAPCRPTVRDQVNATIVAERVVRNATFPMLNATCEASGAGDPREGACGALYGNPGYGPVKPCDALLAPPCRPTPRELLGYVLG